MKRFILYILIVCIPILTGCGDVNIYSAHSEPEDLAVIKTIGIDYESGAVKVTAATGIGTDGKKAEIYSSAASTVAEAVNGIQNGYLGDEAYFSHAKQIVIGEAAAKNGISEILDYIGRNVYMRLSADIYIVKGGTAQELIEKTTGENIAASDMLDAISKKSEFTAAGRIFTCKDIMASLAEKGTALVYVIDKGELLYSGSADETLSIKPVGYGIIKDGYLEEYLDTGVTEGSGILMGNTKSGMLTVEVEGHGTVTLKINNLKTVVSPTFENEEFKSVIIKIEASMNIEEAASELNFINQSLREKIEEAAAKEIEETIRAALDKSKELKSDFCGIGEKLYIKSPYKFADAHDRWEEIYPEVIIEIQVDAKLKRTYDMENSLNYKGEKKGEGQ